MSNLLQIVGASLPIVEGLLPLGGKAVHTYVERGLTIPARIRAKWQSGMSQEDREQNESLWRKAFDALSDAVVHTASKGKIDPD